MNGMYDSLIVSARSSFLRACSEGDSAVALYSGSVLAQSFLFREETDSIMYYIELVSPYYVTRDDVGASRIIYNNVLASYYLRTDLDYSQALRYYLKGLRCAEEIGNSYNQIIILANITNIFYMIGDVHGRKYAEMARRISSENETDAFARCVAAISNAQMLCLSSEYDSAAVLVNWAEEMSDSANLESLVTTISTVRAEIAEYHGALETVKDCFEQAIKYQSYTDPGTASMTYLRYGEFLERNGMLSDALNKYRRGLDVSIRSDNMKFRNELLQRSAEVSYALGLEKEALDYLMDDNGYVGRISKYREQEFNRILLSNQEMMYETSLMERELELLEARRKASNAIFIGILILMISMLLIILYIRQRRMYRKLAEQYQMFSRRLEQAGSEVPSVAEPVSGARGIADDASWNLFLKAEKAMKTEKVFLQKNLTMDTLAEHLATNRTYLSKAINSYSGMTFYRYLDMWRIKEAVRIISESSQKILLKQLSDDLGYSSPSVFYKAFKRETGCLPSQFMRETSTTIADQSHQH